jgi:hypothetical protein
MKRGILEVVIGTDAEFWGDDECYYCCRRLWAKVCHECADKYVWHYCDR